MTALLITRDNSGVPAWGLPFTSDAYNLTLSTGVEQTITVPSSNTNGYLAVFSYQPGTTVWTSNAPITLPTGTPAQSAAQLNPGAKPVAPGTTLHFKTNDASAEVGVSFYELV